MTIERLHSGSRMSQAVSHQGLVQLAGQIGAPGEDTAAQTRAVLGKIEALLAEAGTDQSHILTATIWLADMEDFGAMNAVWDDWVGCANATARAHGRVKLATPDDNSYNLPLPHGESKTVRSGL